MEDNKDKPTVSTSPQAVEQPPIQNKSVNNAPSLEQKPKNRSRIVLPIIVGTFLLIGGAAAAFNTFVWNDPERIWSTAMNRTADGFDSFVESLSGQTLAGGTVNGNFTVESPVAIDGSVQGGWFEDSFSYNAEVGYLGGRAQVEVRGLVAENAQYPDVYIKLNGLSSFEGLLGTFVPEASGLIEEINNNWYAIDRSLIADGLQGVGQNQEGVSFSTEDFDEIATKTSELLREYVFTDDSEKAIIVLSESVGREDFNGRDSFKYLVNLDKENLKQFLRAYTDAIKGTQLEAWLLENETGVESLEELTQLEKILSEIDELDTSQARIEAWVDMEYRLLSNIRITLDNTGDTFEFVELGLDYRGGDELPFRISVETTGGVESNETGFIVLTALYNQATSGVEFGFDVDVADTETIKATGKLSVQLSSEQIKVEVPENSTNILELLGLFLGGPIQPQPILPIGGTEFRDDNFMFEDFEL